MDWKKNDRGVFYRHLIVKTREGLANIDIELEWNGDVWRGRVIIFVPHGKKKIHEGTWSVWSDTSRIALRMMKIPRIILRVDGTRIKNMRGPYDQRPRQAKLQNMKDAKLLQAIRAVRRRLK